MGLSREIDLSGLHAAAAIFAEEMRNLQVWAEAVSRALMATRPGYYLRDGKVRRDHSYFRQRARDRRAAAKRARSASSR